MMMLYDRQHAAHLLAEKLMQYKNSGAIAIGLGSGGAPVAFSLARELNLSFELSLCRKIKHPADPRTTIGSVSEDQVLLNNNSYGIPQDFLGRLVSRLQYEIRHDHEFIFGDKMRPSLHNKTVILVGDLIRSIDTIRACLKSIKMQKPSQLIVAIPVVASSVATRIVEEADDIAFLHIVSGDLDEKKFYEDFPPIDLSEAKKLWVESLAKTDIEYKFN